MKNKLKYISLIFSILISACMFTSCTEVNGSDSWETELTRPPVTDYPAIVGSLTFNESPKQVACLSPAMAEIICELGFSDRITGISIYCDYPLEISGMPAIGSSANPDISKIVSSAPNLLISQSPIAKKDITAIESAGTRVLIMQSPNSVKELYEMYYDMAVVFCGNITAEEKALQAYSGLETVLAGAGGTFESFVYIMTPDGATATGDTFAGDFLSYFGENAAESGTEFVFPVEELAEKNPQYIIINSVMDVSDLPESYQELDAVKEGRVIYIDNTLLERPTSRLESIVDDIKEQVNKNNGTTDSDNEDNHQEETGSQE